MLHLTLYDRFAVRTALCHQENRPISVRGSWCRQLRLEPLEDRCLLARFSGIAEWVSLGPEPIQEQITYENDGQLYDQVGAVQAIAIQPTNRDVIYIATVNGGIWRTLSGSWSRNDGIDNDLDGVVDSADPDETPRWEPLTDDLPSLSMGAVSFDLDDATYRTLYAGPARYSSNGLRGGEPRGLWRTTDAGTSWEELAFNEFQGLNVNEIIARGQVLLVATSRPADVPTSAGLQPGVYRSGNGGDTWTRVVTGQATDLVIAPANSNSYYAAIAGQGIWRGTSGGQAGNWTQLTNQPVGTAASGIILLDTSSITSGGTTTNYVYAAIADSSNLTGISWTTNSGTSWDNVTTLPPSNTGARPTFHHFAFAADPFLHGRMAFAGINGVWIRKTDGNWTNAVAAAANKTGSHADHRDLVFDGLGNVLDASDGGIYRLRNYLDSGQRINESLNGNLRISEIGGPFSLAYDRLNNVVLLGTQDNGVAQQQRTGASPFLDITGADGNTVGIGVEGNRVFRYFMSNNYNWFWRRQYDNQNMPQGAVSRVMLASSTTPTMPLSGLVAADQSVTGFFTVPYAINSTTPSRMLFGTNRRLYESTDRGATVVDVTPGNLAAGDTNRSVSAIAYGGVTGGANNDELVLAGMGGALWLRTQAAIGILQGFQQLNRYATAGGRTPREIVLDPDNWRTAFVLDSAGTI